MRYGVWRRAACLVGVVLLLASTQVRAQAHNTYAWRNAATSSESVASRFTPPPGFQREPLPPGSFGFWLRGLPLKAGRPPVRLYNGQLKDRQDVHVGVIDIDVGTHDLQQCADAVIRLRAEWLFANGRHALIHFHATSGDDLSWPRWASGDRPTSRGTRLRWTGRAPADSGYASFRRYLDLVFTYAGTLSLERETVSVPLREMNVGDVFVKGGSPGHALIVVDMTQEQGTGRRAFIIAQSYMPAQEIHILRSPQHAALDPWYPLESGGALVTPEWTFESRQLRRFPDPVRDETSRQE